MTQDQLDILCVNTQCELGLQGETLVNLLKAGDMSVQAFAADHMALFGLMFSIKDYDIDNDTFTQPELASIEQKIIDLINSCNSYH